GCAKSRRIKDPYSRLDRGLRTEAESNCIWANPVVCGAGVEGIEGKLADKEVLGEGIIVHPPAGAHYCFRIPKSVPCSARSGSEVVEVTRIELVYLMECAGGIKQAEAVLLIADHARIMPAHSVAERQPRVQSNAIQR